MTLLVSIRLRVHCLALEGLGSALPERLDPELGRKGNVLGKGAVALRLQVPAHCSQPVIDILRRSKVLVKWAERVTSYPRPTLVSRSMSLGRLGSGSHLTSLSLGEGRFGLGSLFLGSLY